MKQKIEQFANSDSYSRLGGSKEKFSVYSKLNPIVSVEDCFDNLLVPRDHPSRRKQDTYYFDESRVLRTQTSAHQVETIASGENSFFVFGDVYRRDTVDSTHYPAFHQMEAVRIYDIDSLGVSSKKEAKEMVLEDLKLILIEMARFIFGEVQYRWNEDYFPFTDPSLELEILCKNAWLEILGCGVIHDDVMLNAKRDPNKQVGWAFGLGL